MNKEAIESLCTQLRRRAGRLRLAATGTFILIIATLVGGIYLFLYAGQISIRETDVALSLAEYTSGLEIRMERSYFDIRESLERIEVLGGRPAASELQDDLDELSSAMQAVSKELRDLPAVLASEEALPTHTVVSTIVTRVGSVLLLVFLVQILVTLFKYNSRLASYYDARADALELLGDGEAEDLERIAAILASEAVDFGRAPASPAQYAVELAKELVSSSKRQGLGR